MGKLANLGVIGICLAAFTFAAIEMRRTQPEKSPVETAKTEAVEPKFMFTNPLMWPSQALVGVAATIAESEKSKPVDSEAEAPEGVFSLKSNPLPPPEVEAPNQPPKPDWMDSGNP